MPRDLGRGHRRDHGGGSRRAPPRYPRARRGSAPRGRGGGTAEEKFGDEVALRGKGHRAAAGSGRDGTLGRERDEHARRWRRGVGESFWSRRRPRRRRKAYQRSAFLGTAEPKKSLLILTMMTTKCTLAATSFSRTFGVGFAPRPARVRSPRRAPCRFPTTTALHPRPRIRIRPFSSCSTARAACSAAATGWISHSDPSRTSRLCPRAKIRPRPARPSPSRTSRATACWWTPLAGTAATHWLGCEAMASRAAPWRSSRRRCSRSTPRRATISTRGRAARSGGRRRTSRPAV